MPGLLLHDDEHPPGAYHGLGSRGLQGASAFDRTGAERCGDARRAPGDEQVTSHARAGTRFHTRAYKGARHRFVTACVRFRQCSPVILPGER
jgi:hypothetical protein